MTAERERRVEGMGGVTIRLSENNPFVLTRYHFLYFITISFINKIRRDDLRLSVPKLLRHATTHLDANRQDVNRSFYYKIILYIIEKYKLLRHFDGHLSPCSIMGFAQEWG